MSIYRKSDIPADLQQYFVRAEIGLEETPDAYVARLVEVFREVRNRLTDDGTLWLNIGDSYASTPAGKTSGDPFKTSGLGGGLSTSRVANNSSRSSARAFPGIKQKDLIGIPWMLAFALRADGWYLRQDIIWAKPNCMPESVTDRCTRSHEYIFLLSKSERYFYNHEAIMEPCSESTEKRISQPNFENQIGTTRANGGQKTNGNLKPAVSKPDKQRGHSRRHDGFNDRWDKMTKEEQRGMRNKRDVWWISPMPYSEAHFATYPPDLIRPCIRAGSRPGDTILDPFGGSGTTGQVAIEEGRKAILIELNPDYLPLIQNRTNITPGLGI